jgi:hypothetical protein
MERMQESADTGRLLTTIQGGFRMYNQGFQQNSFQNQFGSQGFVNSQYRGQDTKYQPVGYVQSQYNQSVSPTSFSNQFTTGQQQFGSQFSSYGAPQAQSFHTANYRGNQPGHDAYLRADSTQPAQSQFGTGASNFNTTSQIGASNFGTSTFGTGISSFGTGVSSQFPTSTSQQTQGYYQQQSPQSYHTASYRGNQQGHDAYLRADSVQPAQSQFGIGAQAQSFNNQQQFSTSIPQTSFGQSSFGRF